MLVVAFVLIGDAAGVDIAGASGSAAWAASNAAIALS
jgi:hypothetical protein